MEKPTKALTVRQPWAYLIAQGLKNIENRTWRTKYRGRFYIHAGKLPDKKEKFTDSQWFKIKHIEKQDFILGAIIGEVTIVDCVQNHPSIWAEKGQWHWVLSNPVMYEKPILVKKGALGFWNYKPENEV